ncbi:MAG: gliding motility-associated C-terminal domain-containing protein [Bacteroidetes bacterium]|nr:gliding motility-associated C-terminal domain-containing protein [Bacteroidota bacterium]MDA1176538.1 gliding motility-associated C-terminal domain-containing protein [Bacteroidota bacterium]
MRFLMIMLMLTTYLAKAQTVPCFTFDEGEFVVSGNATIINDDTVRLTQAINNQAGFVWSQSLVNFDLDFSLEAELYLGTQNGGADGIAFVIQAISNNEGSLGGGIGYSGISPSLAIEFDTWWNSGNDPVQEDHVALIANGQPWVMSAHSAYTPYVGVNNLEDGLWHPILISWDGTDKTLSLTLDGASIFSVTIDIPTLFFNGDPNLYWGFTAATGGANNLQQVRILEFCSIDSSCNTPEPTADSPQSFCESVVLNELQTNGSNIRFYAEETGDTLLDAQTIVDESTTVYITQTIDDCESQTLAAIDIIIVEPTVFDDSFELLYCQDNNPTANLFDASNLFLGPDFTGFFNELSDTQSINNLIESAEDFTVTELNQIVYARIETELCYEVYTITLVAENPIIYTNPFEILYCQRSNPTVDLYTASDLFSNPDFSGFFNSLQEAENGNNEIVNSNTFMVSSEEQMVYARVEEGLCYEIYPILLVSENCALVIPQALSPNSDGFNDVFDIQNLYDVHFNHTLKIYNRYGLCIFEGTNDKKWAGHSDDGKLVPVGTYFYVLTLNNEDNEVFTGWVYCNY